MKYLAMLRQSWLERSDRERRVLAGAGVFILLALVYALLWEPGMAARTRLAATLPTLRAQVEEMRLQQRELASLRKKAGATPQLSDPLPAIRASAARAALGGSLARVETLSGGRVLVSSPSLDFNLWLAWVAGLHRELGVRLESCTLAGQPQPGQVRVEAVFAASAGDGRL